MKMTSQTRVTHYQAQTAFYSLVLLALTIYSLFVLVFYQKWQIFFNNHSLFKFCWLFFKSHVWHLGITLLLLIILILSLWHGGRCFLYQYRNNRILNKRIRHQQIPLPLFANEIALKHGLVDQLLLTRDKETYAFVYGVWKPRIVISQGLLNTLTANELLAVLLHEKYHLTKYDPLKIGISHIIVQSLFFLPLANKILKLFTRAKELAADAMAIDVQGGSLSLAQALQKILTQGKQVPSNLPLVGIKELVELRIIQLIHDDKTIRLRIISAHDVILTLSIIALFVFLCLTGCV